LRYSVRVAPEIHPTPFHCRKIIHSNAREFLKGKVSEAGLGQRAALDVKMHHNISISKCAFWDLIYI